MIHDCGQCSVGLFGLSNSKGLLLKNTVLLSGLALKEFVFSLAPLFEALVVSSGFAEAALVGADVEAELIGNLGEGQAEGQTDGR